MDPVTISFTFPGFKNLWNCKFSQVPPESTDTMLVFRLNSLSKKFCRETYSPQMTDRRVSSQEVNQALAVFEIALSRAISSFDLLKSLFKRFFLPYLLIEFFNMFSFIMWIVFVAYCAFGIFHLLTKANKKMERSQAEMKRIIELVQPAYLAKGLRWRVPEDSFGWVELIKDYNCSGKEQVCAPVVEASFRGTVPETKVESAAAQEEGGKTGIDDSLFSCIRD